MTPASPYRRNRIHDGNGFAGAGQPRPWGNATNVAGLPLDGFLKMSICQVADPLVASYPRSRGDV